MNHSIKILAAAALATAVAGCSFNPIGESSFDCNRKENPSAYCRSFKALEKSTNGPLPESRFDKEFRMSDYDRATGIAPDGPAPQAADTLPAAGAALLPHQRLHGGGDPVAGLPVRKAPVVQRVFIKRFVDENDSLQDDMIVYREVRGSRWTGFEAGQGARAAGAYPHRPRNSTPVEADADVPLAQQTNLAQPDGPADGTAGSAMSPAGPQSGGVNVLKTER
ncbi:TraV family lipoprotein [Massilia sp. CT11-137]|uniref:TraV family lipoprotein n=1 Tax=Massilia sp. CT11-137 TaxID=3393901 RepID=UPI0039A40543